MMQAPSPAGESSTTPTDRHADVVVVLGTAPPAEAADLARLLVRQNLAACVNLLPGARSIYQWQGDVCDEQETVLVIKTVRARLSQLEAAYVEDHSYTTPEFVVLASSGGYGPYLDWVTESVLGPGRALSNAKTTQADREPGAGPV